MDERGHSAPERANISPPLSSYKKINSHRRLFNRSYVDFVRTVGSHKQNALVVGKGYRHSQVRIQRPMRRSVEPWGEGWVRPPLFSVDPIYGWELRVYYAMFRYSKPYWNHTRKTLHALNSPTKP